MVTVDKTIDYQDERLLKENHHAGRSRHEKAQETLIRLRSSTNVNDKEKDGIDFQENGIKYRQSLDSKTKN